MGCLQSLEQTEVLGHRPVLRHVQQVQARPMGVRRPPKRRLHAEVRLDRIVRHRMVKGTASPDDPALADYWAERRRKTTPLPTGKTSLRLLEAQQRPLPALRGLAPARRRPAPKPPRMGAMAGNRPHSDHQDRPAGGRHVGRNRTPSHPHPLPPTTHRRTWQRPAASARPRAPGACLSRVR